MSKSSKEVHCYIHLIFLYVAFGLQLSNTVLWSFFSADSELSALGFRDKLSYFLLSHFHYSNVFSGKFYSSRSWCSSTAQGLTDSTKPLFLWNMQPAPGPDRH